MPQTSCLLTVKSLKKKKFQIKQEAVELTDTGFKKKYLKADLAANMA